MGEGSDDVKTVVIVENKSASEYRILNMSTVLRSTLKLAEAEPQHSQMDFQARRNQAGDRCLCN